RHSGNNYGKVRVKVSGLHVTERINSMIIEEE
ncbi:MAG: hypothetical protein H6Q39_1160, partial [Chloroflexi bacterium]|nr:hypothetical protein [Chloroflexota bacterium]